MTYIDIILRNIILGLSLAAPIGPAGVAIIQNGLKFGFARAFLTAIGVVLADITYLLLVFFGLATIIQVTWVQVLVWILGASALSYFGYRSLREVHTGVNLTKSVELAGRHPLVVGYIVNVSNPIAIVWWLGVFGSLLNESSASSTRWQALGLSATILIGIMIWHTCMSLLTHFGNRYVNERTARYISLVAGFALIFFGLRFAYFAYSILIK